jgi:hypothetical protein
MGKLNFDDGNAHVVRRKRNFIADQVKGCKIWVKPKPVAVEKKEESVALLGGEEESRGSVRNTLFKSGTMIFDEVHG